MILKNCKIIMGENSVLELTGGDRLEGNTIEAYEGSPEVRVRGILNIINNNLYNKVKLNDQSKDRKRNEDSVVKKRLGYVE